jgi:GTP-binding protein EngB required for normal cell division
MADISEEFREEIKKTRQELKEALRDIPINLSPIHRLEFQKELKELDEMLERLETGLIWVALFGKASVGKSSVVNSLMGEDVAKVGVEMGTTTISTPYTRYPWKLVDVPGILDGKALESHAIEEAKKAHGHIFVLDGEPTEAELSLFRVVCDSTPDLPRVVYVNKWDKIGLPQQDKRFLQHRIAEKMGELLIPSTRIVYGSAQLYDPKTDAMIRQEIPQLFDVLYDTAGVLGDVINILDPAKRAEKATDGMRNSILEARKKIARKVINWFAIASAVTGFIPLSLLISVPGVLSSMVYLIFLIMGKKEEKSITGKVAMELLKACAQTLGIIFAGSIGSYIAAALVTTINPIAGIALFCVGAGATSVFTYRRTVILGEVTIEYVLNDCSWGIEGQDAVIRRCAKRAEDYYFHLKNKQKPSNSKQEPEDSPSASALAR